MSGPANPFLGPQPYRASERDRFFGREESTRRLVQGILSWPCFVLFGPSGAGKSSLMRAGVIPLLEEKYEFRVVHVESWLASHGPLEWLVQAMFADLRLGTPPAGMRPDEALDEAVRLAERRSDRPVLLYLDQLEQLLLPGRDLEQTNALLESLVRLVRSPFRGLQLALLLREDYLGRFRERLHGAMELREHGSRLGPLRVREMVEVARRLAASGTPAQYWPTHELLELMLQVRVSGQDATEEAEVQAAFAQIVCRALWEERAAGNVVRGPVEAEPILHRYLDATLEGLGPLAGDARRLLEEHLVASDGSRALLTERQAQAALPPGHAERVLSALEGTAVLLAGEHHGSRYFELGHDWLARKVFELRRERLRDEESRRQLELERARWRRLRLISVVALAVAVMITWQASARMASTSSPPRGTARRACGRRMGKASPSCPYFVARWNWSRTAGSPSSR
ncbi:hypothetical protein F0U62_29585 [Cystobacter fuscus]|nr:hypothetical protein F0U62_29585 [Cystobacter fuscus]